MLKLLINVSHLKITKCNKNWKGIHERIHRYCLVCIEKSVPWDHCSASLGKPSDALQWLSGQIFSIHTSHPWKILTISPLTSLATLFPNITTSTETAPDHQQLPPTIQSGLPLCEICCIMKLRRSTRKPTKRRVSSQVCMPSPVWSESTLSPEEALGP